MGGIQGEVISDRGSSFQAHCIKLTNQNDIKTYLSYLKSNNKIQKAAHNIVAYRIQNKTKSFKNSSLEENVIEGFDDDGEDGAGIRLLGFIQKMKLINILVVVSRWFGGTLLGNDRFKHINDCLKLTINAKKSSFEFTD